MSAPMRAKVAHFTDQGYQLKGIVHVGANDGEEIPWYIHMGHLPVWAFEPLPEVAAMAAVNFRHEPEVSIFQQALSDRNGPLTLRIPRHLHAPTDDTKSTSAFRPDRASGYGWGERNLDCRELTVEAMRFDTYERLTVWNVWRNRFNTLVVDVEGMELAVLRGFGSELDTFSFLNVECSDPPIFEGQASAQEVEEYLKTRGFRRDSPFYSHDDVFYVREGLRP